MTILTMIFSQSSIAWRTGEATVANTEYTIADVSYLRFQSDNFYGWNGGAYYIQSVFDENGDLWTEREGYVNNNVYQYGTLTIDVPSSGNTDAKDSFKRKTPRKPSRDGDKINYIVNVMSCGPDREEGTRYDNVYSVSPTDDPNEW